MQTKIYGESVVVLNNFGFQDPDFMFALIQRCKGFHNIITAKPSLSMPCQVGAFLYTWYEEMDLENSRIFMPTMTNNSEDEHTKVVSLILDSFGLTDVENMSLDQIEANLLH